MTAVPTSADSLHVDYASWPRSHIVLSWGTLRIRALVGAGLGSIRFELMTPCCDALLWQDGAGNGVVGARSESDAVVRCGECGVTVPSVGLISPLSSSVLNADVLSPWVTVWVGELDPLAHVVTTAWLESALVLAAEEVRAEFTKRARR